MTVDDQLKLLSRGCVELVSEKELKEKLESGRTLRVKLGVDPTSPDLHLGHSVPLMKLRAFQDLGHHAVLIIGDFTTRVGDPSGRDSTRPVLSKEDIAANAKTYTDQAFKVLDPDKTEVVYNSEWLEPFMEKELLSTLRSHTVQQILARDDFQNRMKANSPITMLELLYPLLQGYDSVAVKADVELGGNDQLFNLLMGREMQKDAGQDQQIAMTLPLLVGLDGVKKMSKSYDNYIGLTDSPRDMFGKVMRVSDEAMWAYYELLTTEDVRAVKAGHPMEAKKKLAGNLVERFHSKDAADAERKFFDETFSKRETPKDVPEVRVTQAQLDAPWFQFLVDIDAAKSKNEARRLLKQGAVKLGDAKVAESDTVAILKDAGDPPVPLKVGKHRFFNLTL
jgi:tyrosyl-tRNA synthetase